MIELDQVSKRYDETTAVDDVSLSVAEGELLVLLGGSGCGKTTTLKMINRLIEGDYFRPEKVGDLKPVNIRIIRMSKALNDSLTYSTKLARDAGFIERLIREGEDQAGKFLRELETPT